ncbi:MAG: DMT family transporter [Bdellovibrionales bacterium]|nr:DMT family transporter [Bdellovibrionales bacterium]
MSENFPEYKKGILFAIGTALCWAVLAILLKFALNFIDANSIVWVRMSVATILIGLSLSLKKISDLNFLFKAPSSVYIAALALGFNYIGYMNCIELTTASNTQIMIQLGPLLLALFGILYFKEIPSRMQLIGFIFALIGFSFFFRDQLLISWEYKDKYIKGNLWVIAAAITWTYFTLVQKSQSAHHSPQKILFVVFFYSSLFLTPFANFGSLLSLDIYQWALLLLLGLNSWVAYAFLSEALKRAPASHISLIIVLNPLLTILTIQTLHRFNLLFIAFEPLNWTGYLGTALVITGVALTVTFQKSKKIK